MRVLGIILISFLFPTLAIGQNLKSGYTAEIIAQNLNPTSMIVDHHGRIWMTEKNGKVLISNENGEILPDPFINLEVDDFNERGLLGITLHPDFDNKPFVYLYFTVPGENRNRVSRFKSSGDLAIPGSEEIILNFDAMPSSIHNGGAMVFDSNHNLYIASGDAGNSSNSQDLNNLLGKILRLNEDGSIPLDNPFYNVTSGANKAIWSIGHRNPFNMIYDHSDGIIYTTDVGAGDYEEINIIKGGINYGWPIVEGPNIESLAIENYQDPYFYYDHEQGCAIVGLASSSNFEDVQDEEIGSSIFFADYCEGFIKYFNEKNPQSVFQFGSDIGRPLNIVFDDHLSAIYMQTRSGIGGGSEEDNTLTEDGKLWKITFTGSGVPSILEDPADQLIPISEEASFKINVIGDQPFTYDWYLNQKLLLSSSENYLNVNFHDELLGLNEMFCIVSNDNGSDTSGFFYLDFIQNSRPVVEFLSPLNSERYKAGDTIFLSGVISDTEEGILSQEKYRWKIDFHHNTHTHPFIEEIRGKKDTFIVVPINGEPDTNVWIRAYLSGKDAQGLEAIDYVDVKPLINKIHLSANINGFISIDGALRELPYDLYSVVNLSRTIEVPETQYGDNHALIFLNWRDGSLENIRRISVGENQLDTLKVIFDTIRLGNGEGLYAEYFNGISHNFEKSPDLVRIDSIIGFKWGDESPDSTKINNDNFSVRWRGRIQSLFSEDYTFHFSSDDGARIWINEELVLDDWIDHPPQESDFTINLDANKDYKLAIEYYENGGGAEAELKWSSAHTLKNYIPKRQLYPMGFGHFHARIWHDKDFNDIIDENEPYIPGVNIILLDTFNNYLANTISNEDGFFAFRDFEAGTYKFIVIPPFHTNNLTFGYGLDDLGYSNKFEITANTLVESSYALVTQALSDTSDLNGEYMKVFPNPFRNYLNLKFKYDGNKEIMIFDTSGQIITSQEYSGKELVVNFDEFNKGIYFIWIKDEEEIIIRKIVKI